MPTGFVFRVRELLGFCLGSELSHVAVKVSDEFVEKYFGLRGIALARNRVLDGHLADRLTLLVQLGQYFVL